MKKRSLAEWVALAEQLAAAEGGSTPDTKWLRRKGHTSLAQAIEEHPEHFKHVKAKK